MTKRGTAAVAAEWLHSDLSSSGDAELLAQHVAVCFRRSRRDPESLADLLVRASGSDQLDHLTLPLRDADGNH